MESVEPQVNVDTPPTRRSDGQDGPPVLNFKPREHVNTPGAQNSALKEAPPTPDEGCQRDHPCAAHEVIVSRDRCLVDGTRKKIAICGFASSTRPYMPMNDPTWSIWTMNQLYRHVPRVDRQWDMHWNWDQENVPGTDHEQWMRECGIPVYVNSDTYPSVKDRLPTSVRFPLERLVEKFGDYFTSSIAEMLAVAIDEIDMRVERDMAGSVYDQPIDVVHRQKELYGEYIIGLFGIDLVVGEEYDWQKACAEWWIGIAIGRGINVMIPPQSALCKQLYRYGYQTEPAGIIKIRELIEHRAKLEAERTEGQKALYMLEGAIQVHQGILDGKTMKPIETIATERDECLKKLLMLEGAIEGDRYWHDVIQMRQRGTDVKL